MAGVENPGFGHSSLGPTGPWDILIIGAGWAGVSAALRAAEAGHRVALIEASRQLGGRARSLPAFRYREQDLRLDNGQHLLMGAYSETLGLMQKVGIEAHNVLLDVGLDLRLPNGQGLALPAEVSSWPSKWLMAMSIFNASGWSWRERLGMLSWGLQWQRRHMQCSPESSVADLCANLPARLIHEWIEPLCVSALNVPPSRASGQLFLNALADTVFADQTQWRGLIPRVPLDEVFPSAATSWLCERGHAVYLGQRASSLQRTGEGWIVNGALRASHVVLALPAPAAADLAKQVEHPAAQAWAACASSLEHTAIATVYLHTNQKRGAKLMQALPTAHPWDAQFVFDWERLGRAHGVLAAVLSHATGNADELGQHVCAQVKSALGLSELNLIKSVVEKRATFAAKPAVKRPPSEVAPRLWACGDYIEGRYPATIEGAVRSAARIPWRQLRGRSN